MHIILLFISIAIIGYNLILNVGNLSNVAIHCLNNNSLSSYWSYYYKLCVHGRAIFSTIISFIIAIFLFFALAVIIGIKSVVFKAEMAAKRESGAVFEYEDKVAINSNNTKHFYTNLTDIGLENIDVTITGNVKLDLVMIITEIRKQCDTMGYSLLYDVRQDIQVGKKVVNIPVLLNINNVAYPLYIIYTPMHKKQYLNIRQTLLTAGIDQTAYFSTLAIDGFNTPSTPTETPNSIVTA